MALISKLVIERFRGIKNLKMENLNSINLLVGDNNCGKTSVLEAVQLFGTYGHVGNVYKIARQRESAFPLNSNSAYENLIFMFPHDEDELSIKINGICNDKNILFEFAGNQKRVLLDEKELNRLSVRDSMKVVGNEMETDLFEGECFYEFEKIKTRSMTKLYRFMGVTGIPTSNKDDLKIIYVAPFEHLKGSVISQIIKSDEYKEICLKALQLFDSDIEDMMIFKSDVGNNPVEYLKHKRLGNMPLSTFGDGIKKVLVLSNAIARAAGGILLIDEIETAIHKKYYDDIFRFIVKACSAFDVQAFITTHSLEAIDGLLATQDYEDRQTEDRISVVTLKREVDNTYSRVLSGREVAQNREAFGFEVRL